MPHVGGLLVSYCGIICQFCPAYRRGLCEGCDPHIDECYFAACAVKRGLKSCLLCGEFPCQAHWEGFPWESSKYGKVRWRVFSDIFLKIMAECQEG